MMAVDGDWVWISISEKSVDILDCWPSYHIHIKCCETWVVQLGLFFSGNAIRYVQWEFELASKAANSENTTQNEYLSRLKTTNDDDENEQHENKHHSLSSHPAPPNPFHSILCSTLTISLFSYMSALPEWRNFFTSTIPRPFLCQYGMLFQFLSWFVKVLIFHVHDH